MVNSASEGVQKKATQISSPWKIKYRRKGHPKHLRPRSDSPNLARRILVIQTFFADYT